MAQVRRQGQTPRNVEGGVRGWNSDGVAVTTAHPHHRPPHLWSACCPRKLGSRRGIQRLRRVTATAQVRRIRPGRRPKGVVEAEVEDWRFAMTEGFRVPRGCGHERRKKLVPEPRSRKGLECPSCEEGWRGCWEGCRCREWLPSLPCGRLGRRARPTGLGRHSPGRRRKRKKPKSNRCKRKEEASGG